MRPPLKFPTSSSLIVAIRPHRWELASAIQSFHRHFFGPFQASEDGRDGEEWQKGKWRENYTNK
ncbi:hypothetical protein Ancab_012432 [Ancistrocladus abbreviatus]